MAGITARGWGWRHAGRKAWAVRDIDLDIPHGQRVLLLGASGAGKSTLMHAIAGVLGGADEGYEEGELLIDGRSPRDDRGISGLVQQDPDSQIILEAVGDELAFGPENLRVPRDEIWRRVQRALALVGLDVPLDRSTSKLSGGQKQRLAIAAALTMEPGVLLLDEPTANIDPAGVGEVREAIERVTADRETTLIVVEHRVEVWADLVDRVIVLDAGGGLLADGAPAEVLRDYREPLLDAGVWVPGVELPRMRNLRPVADPGADAVLSLRNVAVGHGTERVLTGVDLEIPRGRSTCILGPNGAGKSTLAMSLAGLQAPQSGDLVVSRALAAGLTKPVWKWRSRDLVSRIGTVFQEPEHQFVRTTLEEELRVGPKAAKMPQKETDRIVHELLERLGLARLALANPFTLSGGEKRRLSVATVLATRPQLVVLDEPTFGQDRSTFVELLRLLTELLDAGTTIVSVTHDRHFVDVLGDEVLRVEAGGVRREVMSGGGLANPTDNGARGGAARTASDHPEARS